MKRKPPCLWGVAGLLVCFASEAIQAAEAGDRSAPGTPPPVEYELHSKADEPSASTATRCYQTALEGGSDLEYCNQTIAEASVFDDQGRAAAFNNRALINSHSGELEAALFDIERALEILPNVPALLINRGNLLWRLHRYEEASQSYQDAIDESSGRKALAYYNRVFIHRLRGDIDLAARDLETARRLINRKEPPEPGLDGEGILRPDDLLQQ